MGALSSLHDYILRPSFSSLSLECGCFGLFLCSLYSTHHCLLISSMYVHLYCLMLGLQPPTSISFLVSRQWVLCPASVVYILTPLFFSLSLGSGCLSSLHDLHTQTSICFFVSRVWVLCPPPMFIKFKLLLPPCL